MAAVIWTTRLDTVIPENRYLTKTREMQIDCSELTKIASTDLRALSSRRFPVSIP